MIVSTVVTLLDVGVCASVLSVRLLGLRVLLGFLLFPTQQLHQILNIQNRVTNIYTSLQACTIMLTFYVSFYLSCVLISLSLPLLMMMRMMVIDPLLMMKNLEKRIVLLNQ